MTKPKPRKPAPRKASKPTLAQRVADLEETLDVIVARRMDFVESRLGSHSRRLDAQLAASRIETDRWLDVCHRLHDLETRSRYRDASHDEPVSNAGEAIGGPSETSRRPRWWGRPRWWRL